MQIKDLEKLDIPDKSGVYFFKSGEDVIYIGKATSLKDRVRSYFSGDIRQARGVRIEKMVSDATEVSWEEADSVLEALILEANLIKKHKPKANVRDKDNKSFNWVVITNEDYPRVILVRGRELRTNWDPDDIKYEFGPYPHGGELKEALKIIRKIFPYRGEKDPVSKKKARRRSTLNEQIGLTPGFTTDEVSKKEYAKTVRHLKLFFEGKKSRLLKELEREMKEVANKGVFEKAAEIRNRIFALEHIRDVSMLKQKTTDDSQTLNNTRIEGYDVAHMSGRDSVGVMVVIYGGEPQKSEYRKFKIKEAGRGDDVGALAEILKRRLTHDEWPLPKLFVIDGGKAQKNSAEAVLKEFGLQIPVVSVVKNKKHKVREIFGKRELKNKFESEILIADAEAHRFAQNYHKTLRRKFRRK